MEKLSNSNESCISFRKQRSLSCVYLLCEQVPWSGFLFFLKVPSPIMAHLPPQLTVSLSPWLSWEVMIDVYSMTLLGGTCSYYAQRPFLINSQFKPFHSCIHRDIFMFIIYVCINKWLENC